MLLAHYGLMAPYGYIDLRQQVPGGSLLPDGTKTFPKSMLTYHELNFTSSAQEFVL